jgi:menaquinone-specific isochorismate synthase
LLRVTVEVEPGSSPSDVEQHIDDLFERARSWVQAPISIDKAPSNVRVELLPSRASWESSVATAVALIRQGALDKVVLAREERLLAGSLFSPVSTLARLRGFDSEAMLFAMQSGGSWFLGASPERLVRLRDKRVDVTCLAGSIGIGHDQEERHRLADLLLGSEKDLQEHEIVVRSTMSALSEVCEDVTRLPGTPRVATARAVQHLETPVSARMAEAGSVLDLVERLHPTPAVGGYPANRALSVMRELEEIDRGWYAGPFGWTDLDGSGEFAVAIRSALLLGRMASLFAGSGIVADSVPAAEFEETCLKLRPMLSALGAA